MVRDTGSHCFDVIIHTNPSFSPAFPMYQCYYMVLYEPILFTILYVPTYHTAAIPTIPFSTTIPPPCFQFITRRRIKQNFIWHIPWSHTKQGTKFWNKYLRRPAQVMSLFMSNTCLGPCHAISRYWQGILHQRHGQRWGHK